MSTITQTPVVVTAPRRYVTAEEFDRCHDEDYKAEWVRGEVFEFMPATARHSEVGVWLGTLLRLFADHRQIGRVYNSELQIRLPGIRRIPDLCFIARERQEIVKATRVEGAPDLIVEIVSPDSVERDWRDKYLEYEANGVREYWIIDLIYEQFRAYQRDADGRFSAIEEKDGKVASQVLAGFWLRPSDLWQDPLPSTVTFLQELGVL